jgi:hypothetical protein
MKRLLVAADPKDAEGSTPRGIGQRPVGPSARTMVLVNALR